MSIETLENDRTRMEGEFNSFMRRHNNEMRNRIDCAFHAAPNVQKTNENVADEIMEIVEKYQEKLIYAHREYVQEMDFIQRELYRLHNQ